ncbi:MAG: PHP domain-containing protein [Clostridia bacterium]|nr:PHP domain-containing protein [Clostridia bacterium]
MSRFFCDLHTHSCLSPCGDDDSTPANIAGMAALNGLHIAALTDHNTSKNCPAFFVHAENYGVIPVAGMELTTSEDVHAVCLFRTLEDAMSFDRYVEGCRTPFPNRPEIFGRQLLMDENDEPAGEEPFLLINATSLSLEDAHREVSARGGVCFPAHIDRPSNGIITMLGVFPPDPPFTAFELNDEASMDEYAGRFPIIKGLRHVVSSDAHNLADLPEAAFSLELSADPDDPQAVRDALIDYLLGKNKE